MDQQNPYAAPQVESFAEVPPPVDTDAERIRRLYLNHEASVQSIGLLYYLGGGLLVLGMIAGFAMAMQRTAGLGIGVVVMMMYGGMAALAFVLGRGLQTLHRYARIPVVILSCINILLALLSLVVGGSLLALIALAINGYILYLLLSSKGSMIFSAQYAEIRLQTQHIKYRTSIIVRIAAVILLVMLGLGLVGGLVSILRLGK
jgi:hypothetical protein